MENVLPEVVSVTPYSAPQGTTRQITVNNFTDGYSTYVNVYNDDNFFTLIRFNYIAPNILELDYDNGVNNITPGTYTVSVANGGLSVITKEIIVTE